MIIADTPEKIAHFQILALRGAVRLEAVGMKRSRGPSALSIAKKMGFKAKTAKEMYDVLTQEIEKRKGGA